MINQGHSSASEATTSTAVTSTAVSSSATLSTASTSVFPKPTSVPAKSTSAAKKPPTSITAASGSYVSGKASQDKLYEKKCELIDLQIRGQQIENYINQLKATIIERTNNFASSVYSVAQSNTHSQDTQMDCIQPVCPSSQSESDSSAMTERSVHIFTD